MIEPRKSRAGMLLYRQLPEEYRYRDNRTETEWGDLEAYLDGFGAFLDRIRETLEQSYADAFAETADNGVAIQPWLVSYLADLLQAELLSPDPEQRQAELNATVGWYKSKGTLQALDSIADTVAGNETLVVEGWRRTLIAPRLSLPPFTVPRIDRKTLPPNLHDNLPLGAPDLRFVSRAVPDPDRKTPVEAFVLPEDDAHTSREDRKIHWMPSSRRGAPCFPGHFDDRAVRTPDIGDFSRRAPGPHPGRVHLHVQPPMGLFEAGQTLLKLSALGDDPLGIDRHVARHGDAPYEVTPARIYALHKRDKAPERLRLVGRLRVPAGAVVHFADLLFVAEKDDDDYQDKIISVAATGRLTMTRCAAILVSLEKDETGDMLKARDSLFGEILGPASSAQLEYVTVLGETTLGRLRASDCIFVGAVVDFQCAARTGCVRYSRVPPKVFAECAGAGARTNTAAEPRFIELLFKGEKLPREARYGEPGCAVLASDCPPAIAAGAEDRGEMGAHHHRFQAARLRAIRGKYLSFLPVGQGLSIGYDQRLVRPWKPKDN